MIPRARAVLACSLALAIFSASAIARAETEAERKAAQLYQQGVKLLQDRRHPEALAALDASLALRPGPNTRLVRAHALRLLGRKVEAITAYEAVVSDAGERVRGGDDPMKSTLADAGRWVAILRAELGLVEIELAAAPEGVTLSIDGKAVTVERGTGNVGKARVYHEPGRAQIAARSPSGEERSQAADIAAGGAVTVRLDLGPAPASAAPARSKLPPVATWVTWGVGVAGAVTFGVFGSMARSKAAELEACSPNCPESRRPIADAGKRDALIANVAIGVGAAGLVAGAVVWIVSAAAPADKAAPTVSLDLGPGRAGIGLSGRF